MILSKNCKYVVLLEDGSYIYAITETQILKCKSRLRARQFNPSESNKLKRVLRNVQLVLATWEHVDTPKK